MESRGSKFRDHEFTTSVLELDEGKKHRDKRNPIAVVPFILVNEFCERLAFYSVSTNLVEFMITQLGYGNADAANMVTNWNGTVYLLPLLGAYMADAHWGRYITIIVFSIIYLIGLVGLVLSSGIAAIKTVPFFVSMLYIMALGTGGIKPCVSTFGADQFDEEDPKQEKQKSAFFNWFYWSINLGALIATTGVVNVQAQVSWTIGYIIPAVCFFLAFSSFLFGTPWYRKVPPFGSAIVRSCKVMLAALVKWRVRVPKDPALLYETPQGPMGPKGPGQKLAHTDYATWLDKAAVQRNVPSFGGTERWLFTVTSVEETKRMLSFLPIVVATIMFNTIYAQMSTLFVEQGMFMDLRIGPHAHITSATLNLFDTLAIILLVPLYDLVLVPLLARRGIRITYLQRIGWGLLISTFSMVLAAIVEAARLAVVRERDLWDEQHVPVSVFWLTPQYFVIGAAEIMVNIGTLEMFYSEAPESMRSTASAMQLVTVALGNYLSSALVSLVMLCTTRGGSLGWIPDNLNRGRLDLFYTLLVVLSVLNLLFFLLVARSYKYKQVAGPDAKDVLIEDGADLHGAVPVHGHPHAQGAA